MWEISNATQVMNFLYSIALGVIFAIIYDIFRSIRVVKVHSAIMVFLEDIFYFSIISTATFIFLLAVTYGEIRAFVIIGIGIGFLLFFLTLSRYFLKILTYIFNSISSLFKFFIAGFYYIFEKIDYFISSFLKNTLKYCKKVLKIVRDLLYTNRN